MNGFIGTQQAYGLTQGMARAAGVNLPAAVLDGWFRRDELEQLVARCQSCGKTVLCGSWLSVRRMAPLPDYCDNKTDIEALSPGV